MLADFVLRLAAGLAFALLLLSPADSAHPPPGQKPLANAHFFRTQLLVILGLALGALLWLWPEQQGLLLGCLAAAAGCALFGSVSWSLESSPFAVTLLVLTVLTLGVGLGLREPTPGPRIGAFSSALLLGAATSAMLMGHNYLVAPTLTMTPLYRLLAALALGLVVRMGVEGWALGRWVRAHDLESLPTDAVLWLPVRWLVGLAGPAVLTVLAWQTARIRSTQSATGILYVVVIFSFLGELTGLLLRPTRLTL